MPGMSWLVGMMFRSGLDEQCAFRLFFTLMEAYGLAELYAHDCQGLKVGQCSGCAPPYYLPQPTDLARVVGVVRSASLCWTRCWPPASSDCTSTCTRPTSRSVPVTPACRTITL